MKKFFKLGCFGFIGVILLFIIIGVLASGDEESTTTEPKEQTKTSEQASGTDTSDKKDSAGKLTKEKFEQITDGMTYEEVVKIIGAEGTLISETGEKGTDFHTLMYEFPTDGMFSNANMMFQGGKLINKAQFGLDGAGSDVKITLEQFNQIENGMTIEEVVAIVGGEGEILSESGEKGTDLHKVMYSYSGEGELGANVSLMFQSNKLQNKSQFGLK